MPDYELTPVQMIEWFETLSAEDASSCSAPTASISVGASVASSASSFSDDFALDVDESDAAEFAEERRDTVVENNKMSSPATFSTFVSARRHWTPRPAALKKRPRRLRGRSETTFHRYLEQIIMPSVVPFLRVGSILITNITDPQISLCIQLAAQFRSRPLFTSAHALKPYFTRHFSFACCFVALIPSLRFLSLAFNYR
jgi:hypothetical protein